MLRKTTIASAIAVALLSTTAFGATMMANNSNKGSLQVAPRIDVRPGVDTYITLANDASTGVTVKCYYRTSTPTTGLPGPTTNYTKRFVDFSFPMTPHQSITWSAATGETIGGQSRTAGASVAVPFGLIGQNTGELKCWAVGTDPATGMQSPIFHNHLLMDIKILGAPAGIGGQAYEYNGWAFQVLVGTPSGVSGNTADQLLPTALPTLNAAGEYESHLLLDGQSYDRCPNMLVGTFHPSGAAVGTVMQPGPGLAPAPATSTYNLVTIAACNQDMTERNTPTITKYLWTFWTQDEVSRTGFWECGDSYYERDLTTVPFGYGTLRGIGTSTAMYTVESIADTTVCTGAKKVGMLGVKTAAFDGGIFVTGTNSIGRGTAVGDIGWNPTTGDTFKK